MRVPESAEGAKTVSAPTAKEKYMNPKPICVRRPDAEKKEKQQNGLVHNEMCGSPA